MFELYLDTADLEKVKRFNACLPLKGITTNPSILAKQGVGVNQLLTSMSEVLGEAARFHVQVVSATVSGILEEAIQLNKLPYDLVVKVPATEIGLAAIKKIKQQDIPVLATAIYSAEQGFMAALSGADYLAPYVNRIDTLGVNGINAVADLQWLLEQHQLNSKILAASFKSSYQAMEVMKLGIGAITLPVDVAEQMITNTTVQATVEQFSQDWQAVFPEQRSFQS